MEALRVMDQEEQGVQVLLIKDMLEEHLAIIMQGHLVVVVLQLQDQVM